jgi:hypothetical protein
MAAFHCLNSFSKKARQLILLFFRIMQGYLHTFLPLIGLQESLDWDQPVEIESTSVEKRYRSYGSIYFVRLNNSLITIYAYFSIFIYVWVEYFGGKLGDWWFIRIIIQKLYLKSKCSSLPYRVEGSIYYSLPLEKIILIWNSIYSLLIAFLYLLQVLNQPSLSGCCH